MSEQKLYIMKNSFGLTKIGVSVDPDRRANEIRLSSGVHVDLLKTFKCKDAYAVEQWLHEEFKCNREHGEWFNSLCTKKVIKRVYEHPLMRIPLVMYREPEKDRDFKIGKINKSDVGNKCFLGWATRVVFQGVETVFTAATKNELKTVLEQRGVPYEEGKFKKVKLSIWE